MALRFRFRLCFVAILIVVSMQLSESARIARDVILKNELPRGPVPPSGPSPCHNEYVSYHGQLWRPNGDLICDP
ncbi:hypothetical protein Sjap_014878 [Stephania japonica]|uniref:Uncharacterized protein n=1 Tax=Stephania japonica TaxID=461633 RepID=A0AAP0NTG3_9MAGN